MRSNCGVRDCVRRIRFSRGWICWIRWRCRYKGLIDEGNQIYFYQVGINGASAQKEVIKYFHKENEILKADGSPSHKMFLKFLNEMADKFQGCASEFAKAKGMTGTITEIAALKEGDTRLLK